MKKIILGLLLVTGFLIENADAQFRVGVSINIGDQPDWGPRGYDYAEYYYFPDIDMYYDIPHRQFIYFDNGVWEFSDGLPFYYRDFDLYHSYKVVINEPRPYLRDDFYKRQYYQFRGYHNQQVIRERRKENFERRNIRYERPNRYERDYHFRNYRNRWGDGDDRRGGERD